MIRSDDINEREHFNHWSLTYERSIMQWLLFDRVHRGVLARIPIGFNPSCVLDIGCGTGRLLRRMEERWPSVTLIGVDLAEGMLNQAHKQSPRASLYLSHAEDLPLRNGSVDLVTSTASFHHWSDQAQGVREAVRVLRRGGLFLLADMSISLGGRPMSRSRVRSLFEASGLSIQAQSDPVIFFTFTLAEKK